MMKFLADRPPVTVEGIVKNNRFVWGVGNGLIGTPATFWFRADISKEDAEQRPLDRAHEIMEDVLEMMQQITKEEVAVPVCKPQRLESVSSSQLPLIQDL